MDLLVAQYSKDGSYYITGFPIDMLYDMFKDSIITHFDEAVEPYKEYHIVYIYSKGVVNVCTVNMVRDIVKSGNYNQVMSWFFTTKDKIRRRHMINSRSHKSHTHATYSDNTIKKIKKSKQQRYDSIEQGLKPYPLKYSDSWDGYALGYEPHIHSKRQSSGWKRSTKDRYQWEHNVKNKKGDSYDRKTIS